MDTRTTAEQVRTVAINRVCEHVWGSCSEIRRLCGLAFRLSCLPTPEFSSSQHQSHSKPSPLLFCNFWRHSGGPGRSKIIVHCSFFQSRWISASPGVLKNVFLRVLVPVSRVTSTCGLAFHQVSYTQCGKVVTVLQRDSEAWWGLLEWCGMGAFRSCCAVGDVIQSNTHLNFRIWFKKKKTHLGGMLKTPRERGPY